MALDFARPSPVLMREFEAVARQAARFEQALRQSNVEIFDIRQPLLDNVRVLEALPHGTAEAGRILLDHANNRLNEVRSVSFAIEPGADDDSSGAQRGVPLDDALALLIAAIGTALATANREAGEHKSTRPPTEAQPASAAPDSIEASLQQGQETVSAIGDLRRQSDRILKRESEHVDLLSRRLMDAESLTRQATAELRFGSMVPRWIRGLGRALSKTPKLLRGAADLIDAVNDVASPFYDQWKDLKKGLQTVVRSHIPKLAQNLRTVADRLESGGRRPDRTAVVKPPSDFDLETAREMILAGQTPSPTWVPWIAELNFDNEQRLIDIAPLRSLTELQSLSLNRTPVSDIAPLQNLTALQTLSLDGTQVSDIGAIQGLTALRFLSLNGTLIKDLKPLRNLTALQSLWFDGTQMSDVTDLRDLTALQTLSLSDTQVRDIRPIRTQTALRNLWLDRTEISDIADLRNLTALQTLALSGTQVRDIKPLENLTALQSLWLDGTQMSNIGPLRNLTALQILALSGTQVRDLRPLRDLTSLKSLWLDETQISDIAPIRSLTALQTLSLKKTQVSDLRPLTDFYSLKVVWVESEERRARLAPTLGSRGAIVKNVRGFAPPDAEDEEA